MKLSTPILWRVCLLCLALTSSVPSRALAVTSTEDVLPTQLAEDEKGVLWVKRGNDGLNPRVMAERLSMQTPYFVIYVSTTDEYEERAIQHALNLAKWFEGNPEVPSKIPVVAYRSEKNTHYYFEISGFHYTQPELAPNGIMGPQEAHRLREDAVLTYRARMALREQGEFDFLTVKEVPIHRNRD